MKKWDFQRKYCPIHLPGLSKKILGTSPLSTQGLYLTKGGTSCHRPDGEAQWHQQLSLEQGQQNGTHSSSGDIQPSSLMAVALSEELLKAIFTLNPSGFWKDIAYIAYQSDSCMETALKPLSID